MWFTDSSAPKKARSHSPRPLVFVLAVAVLSVGVLYVAEFDPQRWWQDHEADIAAQKAPNVPAAPRAPITVVQPTPTGTASSVSAVPLALHLVAARPGRNASEGYADIGVEVQSPQTYRAGALLVNGAKLSEIYTDHIVLTRGGRSAALYLEGHVQSDAAQLAVAGSMLTAGGVSPVPVAHATSRDTLTEVMRVSPAYEGDRLLGLQVYAGGDTEGFQALGLQPGDRIAVIDGVAVTNVELALRALRQVTRGQAVAVELYRGGQAFSLALDGAALRLPGNNRRDAKGVRS